MPKYSVKQFADNIRKRNPEHDHLDDVDLVQLVAKKNPQKMEYIDREDLALAMRDSKQKRLSKQRQKTFKSLRGVSRFGMGATHGAVDTFMGIVQLLQPEGSRLTGTGYSLPPSETSGELYKKHEENKAEYLDMSKGDVASGLGEFAGSMLATAPVPAATGVKIASKVAAPIAKGAIKLATAMGVGGAMGASEYVDEDETRLKNTLYGGLFGAGGALLGKLGGKVVNRIKQKYANASVQELQDLAKKHGVELSLGDLTEGNMLKKAEIVSENVPIAGMSGFREKGAEQVKESATKVVDKAKKEMLETGEKMGDDWKRIIQKSGNKVAKSRRAEAKKLYDEAGKLAGDAPIKAENTTSKVNEMLSDMDILPDSEVSKMLQGINKGISEEVDFQKMRKLRSKLGAKIDDLSLTNRDAARQLGQIKTAVEKDLGDFSKTIPDMDKAYKKANTYFKNEVVPLKDKMLAKAMKTDEPDQIYKKFIQKGAGDRAGKFYNALDDKGKSAVRYGMLTDAYDNALNKDGSFSPARFTTKLNNLKAPKNVFFKGDRKKELEGFEKLMIHSERFGQYAENPPTGNRLAQILGAASLSTVGIPASALAIRLLSSKEGKRLLLAASNIEVGSNKLNNLLANFQKNMPKATAITGKQLSED